MARETQHRGLVPVILHNLGNLFTSELRYDDALAAYAESIELARANGRFVSRWT